MVDRLRAKFKIVLLWLIYNLAFRCSVRKG